MSPGKSSTHRVSVWSSRLANTGLCQRCTRCTWCLCGAPLRQHWAHLCLHSLPALNLQTCNLIINTTACLCGARVSPAPVRVQIAPNAGVFASIEVLLSICQAFEVLHSVSQCFCEESALRQHRCTHVDTEAPGVCVQLLLRQHIVKCVCYSCTDNIHLEPGLVTAEASIKRSIPPRAWWSLRFASASVSTVTCTTVKVWLTSTCSQSSPSCRTHRSCKY